MIRKIKEKILRSNLSEMDLDRFIKLRNSIQTTKIKLVKWYNIRKYNTLMHKCNSAIPLSVKIGKGLVLPHGLYGIFVSSGAVIGNNCVIFQQVTIGSNTLIDSKNIGSPIIGNNVYIGAGAKIIGNVTVGDNVRIGANAVVVQDVPSNTTVVGEKFRMIEHNNKKDNKYYSYSQIKDKINNK